MTRFSVWFSSTLLIVGGLCVLPNGEVLAQSSQEFEGASGPNRETYLETTWIQGEPVPGSGPPAAVPAPAANPVASPEPKLPSVTVTGFFQADSAWFSQDAASVGVFGDIDDFTDFRRARLAAKGKVADNIGYMVEFDFGFPGRPTFMDVYGEFLEVPGVGTIRIGQFRQPLSMDALTSVKELTFLERNLSFAAFLPFRQVGIEAFNTYLDEQGTWAISGYRVPTNPFGTEVGDGGYGLSGRVTLAPWLDQQHHRVLHTGVGYSYNRPGTGLVRFRSTPEIGVTAGDFSANPIVVPFFVDTGDIATDSFSLYNAELAGSWGPALMQSEVYFATVDVTGSDRSTFSGAYAQVSYLLTGEHRPYNTKMGVFERPALVKGSQGRFCPAWELATRWSYLNLNDGVIQGGELNDLTCGLNCYVSKNAKLQFDYTRAFQNQPGFGDTDTNVVATRFQIDF